MRIRPALVFAAFLIVDVAACGARSSLFVGGEPDVGGGGHGAHGPSTGGGGMGPDASDADADDAFDAPEAPPPICFDAGVTFIYLITENNDLFSFYPPNQGGGFTPIGQIQCNDGQNTPFSMGVDRKGTAYVLFTDGNIFEVDTADAKCKPTPFQPDQHGFHLFGMGFSANVTDPGETLFVVENSFGTTQPSKGLASIDVKNFKLSFVGPFNPTLPTNGIEFTGTGDGKLFGYGLDLNGSGGFLMDVDKTNADVATTHLSAGNPNSALAFAFWGGDFYIFTSSGNGTRVSKYHPGDADTTHYTDLPNEIVVGAGVSTCAPE